ncbi:MAG: ABC-F family ATP-binding cassette domain-containing protein [Negativicutes bacterium]|nr:ABC-F family ATP-binding cassette domain-containing protein [Negativicutes bacterium]MBP9537995.1 ABC-F family ATP-binding cassette domain-containing protein [Negativicutes bacterium]MBP9949995.1 ABC-F family ATP-binding cassette domain-containing protein [Negativicutes bacterium]
MILTVENLSKSYGEKILFENINFTIDNGDKIGLVGVNGTGKSTFIKTIAGLVTPDYGSMIKARGLQIECLLQDAELEPDNTVLMEVFKGNQPIMKVLAQYEQALKISETENNKLLQDEVLKLSQEIDRLDGWKIESDAKIVLTKLGITDFSQKIKNLSGGQKKRVALAASLINICDLLILDEPTNHLDSETIIWLEEYLAKYKGALLMVTHDRYFLDNVATKILELDRGSSYIYQGNYSQFLEGKLQREDIAMASERKRQNLYRTELAWIKRGAKARTTKQKARIDRFEELRQQKFSVNTDKIEIGMGTSRLGKMIIEIENLTFNYQDKKIIENFSYNLLRNDRIGIIGNNGLGKSTLLNLIAGKLEPTTGNIKIGQTVKIGYFSQETIDMDERLRAIEYIKETAHFITLADGTKLSASQLMETFLFSGDLQWTYIGKLSGGEKRRLYLLKILIDEPNILLLDEPTNDLDMQTLSILEDFIDNFNGAIIFVSHDRYFIDRLAQKSFIFEGDGKIRISNGGYSDYKDNIELESEIESPKVEKLETTNKNKAESAKKKLTFKEQREYSEIEAVIAEVESYIKVLEGQINSAGSNFELLQQLTKDEIAAREKLDYLLERWAYLEEIAQEQL